MSRAIVVFDTSVLFSAIGWGGKPGQCLQLARDGTVEGATCEEVLSELSEKLQDKLGFSDEQVVQVVGALRLFLHPIELAGTLHGVCADPKDDMVLECAVAAAATHVVSGDKKHLLALKRFQGILMVSPAELLQAVGVTGDHP